MTINNLLAQERQIWGTERLSLEQVIVRLGVVYGDLCRHARSATSDRAAHSQETLQKELGNVIASTIRWCDDLGFDPNECIVRALAAQKSFAARNNER